MRTAFFIGQRRLRHVICLIEEHDSDFILSIEKSVKQQYEDLVVLREDSWARASAHVDMAYVSALPTRTIGCVLDCGGIASNQLVEYFADVLDFQQELDSLLSNAA